MEPIEKMPHGGDIQVRPPYRGAPGWILRPSGIRRTNSSSRSHRSGPVELQRDRGRLVRQTRNASGYVISMSHRSGLGLEAHPLTVLSHRLVGEEGCLCTDRAALQDEASLYGRGRQRSNFSVQARRGRAGEVLEE